jgi:nucleoside-diphosphate-sugar epimerase
MFTWISTKSAPTREEPAAALGAVSGKRTILIGTAVSVAQLHHVLAVVHPGPLIIGCLLPEAAVEAAELPVPCLGSFDELGEAIAHHVVEQALLSLPGAMSPQIIKLSQQMDRAGLSWRFMPTLTDQLAGRVPVIGARGAASETSASTNGPTFFTPVPSAPWMVDPVALLDRRPKPLDEDAISRTIEGKTVMITGAGGSIGSELAKAVCRFKPGRIVLLERGENALFEIDRQIGSVWPDIPRSTVLHDVTDAPRTLALVMAHKPSVIFHAAAHKHVPMMEEHPSAALENNFYGTRSIADAAAKCGVDRFVMTSSDKAVNPSSVMGATKRLAELYLQWLNARSETLFAMVRFGNVLGSACSVIPIWAQQLAQGGAITVTHPEMTRYFMTIPEAAGLVLQSAAYAGGSFPTPAGSSEVTGGGEVFLLDMGRPIRILDLARRFIRSQGLEPDLDVKIRFTGVRPGEKLFEELAYNSEAMIPTPHPSVRLWQTTPPDAKKMQEIVRRFEELRGQPGAGEHFWQGASKHELMMAIRAGVPEMVRPASDPVVVVVPGSTIAPPALRNAG